MALSSFVLPFHSMSSAWRRFESHAAKRPVVSSMATSAALWATGDVVSQCLRRKPIVPDVRKTALTSAFGGLFFGPLGYAWYSWLDVAARALGPPSSLKVVLAKVVADNMIWSAAYVGMFMAFSSLVIERDGLHTMWSKLSADYLPTMCVYSVVWPPIMALVFMRVPAMYQLLTVNCLTVVDACSLSWLSNARRALALQGAAVPLPCATEEVNADVVDSSESAMEAAGGVAGAAGELMEEGVGTAWPSGELTEESSILRCAAVPAVACAAMTASQPAGRLAGRRAGRWARQWHVQC